MSRKRISIILLILLGITIAFAGYLYFRNEARITREENQNELTAVARLKISQISEWYNDEIYDAKAVSQNPFFVNSFNRWLKLKNNKNKQNIIEVINTLKDEHSYDDILITTADGTVLASGVDTIVSIDSNVTECIRNVLDTKFVTSTNLYRSKIYDRIFLDFISFIPAKNGNPLYAVIFRMDPYHFLYPLMQSWPYPSKTSETLLVQGENDSVVYLTELRHIKNNALQYKISMNQKLLPAVKAISKYTGIYNGKDYRGEKVLAYLSPVAGTPWYLVAKIDTKEVYKSFKKETFFIMGQTSLLILLLILGSMLFYSDRQRRIYSTFLQTEEEFRTTLYSIDDGVLTFNKTGHLLHLNPVAAKLTGWKEKEAKGKSFEKIITIIEKKSRAKVILPFDKILTEGSVIRPTNHMLLVDQNKNEIQVSLSGAPIKNKDGMITGVVLVIRNQTEESKKQRLLEENESRFTAFMNNLPSLVLIKDDELRLIYTNPYYQKFFPVDKWMGKKPEELFPPEISRPMIENDLLALEKGYIKYEEQWNDKDGNEHIFETHKFRIERGDDPPYLGAIIMDITEQKMAESALTRERSRFASLITTIPDNIYFKDTESRFIGANNALIEAFGLTHPDEVIGKTDFDFFDQEHAKDAFQDEQRIIATGIPIINKEEKETWTDGHISWVSTTKIPMHDENGKITGIMGISRDTTERKIAEEALRISEERYKLVSELTSDYVFKIDFNEQGKLYLSFVSESFAAITGRKIDDARTLESWGKIFHPEDLGTVNEFIQQLIVTKQGGEIECRTYVKNRQLRWIGIIAHPILNANQSKVISIIGSVKDITERKQAEIILQESEEKFRIAFDNAPSGMGIFSNDGRFLAVNPILCQMFGYSKEELLNRKAPNITHPDDIEKSNIWANQLMQGDYSQPELEKRYLHKDGHIVWGLVRSQWIKNPDGSPRMAIIHIMDITERIKAQQALRESEEIFRNFLEYSPVYVFFKDENIRSVKLSKNYEQLLGRPLDELLGKTMDDLFPSELAKRMIEDDKSVLEQGKLVVVDEELNDRFYTTIKYPIIIDNKNRYLAGFTIDNTDRKIANEEMMKQKTEIEKQNKEYEALNKIYQSVNAELLTSNEELALARDKAEESDKLKSAFLANMSHEIRTPMNAIIGFSDLISEPNIPAAKLQQFTRTIKQRSYDLLTLINDILDISKIEAGQMTITEESGSIKELVTDIYNTFKTIWCDSGKSNAILNMSYNITTKESVVFTDFGRVRQILTNLVGNAFKFTKEGSITIACKKKNESLLFYVKDTGLGIQPEKQAIIFDRFRQIDEAHTQLYGGTGLGLSISKGLTELLGGEIWVESEPGKGSTFYFTIPYKPDNTIVEPAVEKKPTVYKWENKKILLVEDDEYNSQYILEALKETGTKITQVDRGEDAIELIKNKQPFDLILLDIRLPDIEGYEVARQIKQYQPKIPIIAQTAYASETYKNRCLEAGCACYIVKPIHQGDLFITISQYIDKN